MGAWGYGVWENDSALDVRDDYEYMIAEGWAPQVALLRLENDDEILDFNFCVMALAELQIEHVGRLFGQVKERIERVVEEELSQGIIDTWKEGEKRIEQIQKFKGKIEKFI